MRRSTPCVDMSISWHISFLSKSMLLTSLFLDLFFRITVQFHQTVNNNDHWSLSVIYGVLGHLFQHSNFPFRERRNIADLCQKQAKEQAKLQIPRLWDLGNGIFTPSDFFRIVLYSNVSRFQQKTQIFLHPQFVNSLSVSGSWKVYGALPRAWEQVWRSSIPVMKTIFKNRPIE